jgi:hypothetical protein
MTNEVRAYSVEESDLAGFDDGYAAAEVEKSEPAPDGKYNVIVEQVELTRSRTAGNPMLNWTLRILDGPHAGRCLFRHNMIITADNLKWLKTDLHCCGLELEKVSDLPANLERLLDVRLAIAKKTKDASYSVYFDRRIDGGSSNEPGVGAGAAF